MRFFILILLIVSISACFTTEAERLAAARAYALEKADEAERLYEQGLWEEAAECAEDGLEEDRTCLAAVRVKVRSLTQLLRIAEAFELLLDVPAEDVPLEVASGENDDFRVACLVEAADLAMKLGQPTVAAHYLVQATELLPGRADLLTQKGIAEARSGQELLAKRTFEKALVAGADLRAIRPHLAQIAYTLQEYDEAARHLEKIGAENLTAQELILYGAICCEQKRFGKGLDLFRAAENKDGSLLEALFNQGQALEAMNKVRYAMAIYKKLLERDATYPPALYRLGNLLYSQGEKEEGLTFIDRAIENESDPKTKRSLESSKKNLMNPEPEEKSPQDASPEEAPRDQDETTQEKKPPISL